MSDFFRDGLVFYKNGKYKEALELFQLVTEEDPENDKAWNAAGICHSKLGDIKKAESCFENALMINPDNPTYRKNQDYIQSKTGPEPDPEPVQKPEKPPDKKPRYDDNSILLVILFFVPIGCFMVNIWFGAFVLLISAFLIYSDAKSVHAGIDPYVKEFESAPARDWGIGAFLLWIIIVPVYIYKRRAIFNANIDYYLSNPHADRQGSAFGTFLKVIGGIVLLCIIAVFVSVLIFGISPGYSYTPTYSPYPEQPLSVSGAAPDALDTIQNSKLSTSTSEDALDLTWYSSRDLLIRDLERCAQYEETFRLEYESGNIQGAGTVVSEWYSVVTTERASLLLLVVPEDKKQFKDIVNNQLKLEQNLAIFANAVISGKITYNQYLDESKSFNSTRDSLLKILSLT